MTTPPSAVDALMPISASTEPVSGSYAPVTIQMNTNDATTMKNQTAICVRPRLKGRRCSSPTAMRPSRNRSLRRAITRNAANSSTKAVVAIARYPASRVSNPIVAAPSNGTRPATPSCTTTCRGVSDGRPSNAAQALRSSPSRDSVNVI